VTREEHPGGAIAMKLLQGYLWHPKDSEPVTLPSELSGGAQIALDEIAPPFAFFDDGTYTGTQTFYQLTVFEIFPEWPDNATMSAHALRASRDLEPLLNATPAGVGWNLAEDLRPA
jgi:hypothetical protein